MRNAFSEIVRRCLPAMIAMLVLAAAGPVRADETKPADKSAAQSAKEKEADSEEFAVDPAAVKMMQEAHAARATWPQDFPGFTANIEVRVDNHLERGTASISADGEVKTDLPDGAAKKWAEEQLASIAMHSTAGAAETYEVSFADKAIQNPLGRLIRFHGGATHSLYRIQDDVITEVHRTMGQTKFTISVTDTERTAENKVLPRHFNVSYWEAASGVLLSNKDYQVSTVRVGKYDLPERRLMIATAAGERGVKIHETGGEPDARRRMIHGILPSGRMVYEMRLSDHKLLEK